MSDKPTEFEADDSIGDLKALNGYEYHTIQVYGGQEDGATVCRILSPMGNELHVTTADDFDEAVNLAEEWIDETLDNPGYKAAQNHIDLIEAELAGAEGELAVAQSRIAELEAALKDTAALLSRYRHAYSNAEQGIEDNPPDGFEQIVKNHDLLYPPHDKPDLSLEA